MRPIKLQPFHSEPEDDATETAEGTTYPVEDEECERPSSGAIRALPQPFDPPASLPVETIVPLGEEGAHHLLKRTPSNYVINQVYGLWVYASLFLLTILITRRVSVNNYAIYTDAAAAFNTIAYIVAFGLEDATTTLVPRLASEHGQAAAASLIRRLLGIRLLVLGLTLGVLLFSMPALACLFAAIPTPVPANLAAGRRDPNLQTHA